MLWKRNDKFMTCGETIDESLWNIYMKREKSLDIQTFRQQMRSIGIRPGHQGEPTRKPLENVIFLQGARRAEIPIDRKSWHLIENYWKTWNTGENRWTPLK